jgi:hypothetical protein
MDKKIKEIYYDPKKGFINANKLYEKLKNEGYKIPKKDVVKFVNSQTVNQIFKPIKANKKFSSYKANYPRHIYQIDIMIYDRYVYNKYKYILVIVDIYSRYANARAMTNKTLPNIIKKYNEMIEEMGKPYKLQADNEFNKKEFINNLEKDETTYHYFQANEENKNALVERFNLTLARILQKIRTVTKNYNWASYLSDVIENYNDTIHSTTNKTPKSIFFEGEYNEQEYNVIEPVFKVNDTVRIINKKKTFDKGDKLKLSADIYKIESIDGEKIKLDGLTKTFKPYQIYEVTEGTKIIEPKSETKNNNIKHQLKREDIKEENVLTTKRNRKPKIK